MPNDHSELDRMQAAYKAAVEEWVAAIKQEEDLASVNHTVAEIELPREDHPVELPPWIGPEVTGQSQYYDGSLAMRPFDQWAQPGRRERANTQR